MPTKPADTPPPEVEPEGAPAQSDRWVYTGPDRIYSNVPVTATTGAIIAWPTDPGMGDGCWTITDQDANTLPDNYRPEPTEAEAAKARGDANTTEEG